MKKSLLLLLVMAICCSAFFGCSAKTPSQENINSTEPLSTTEAQKAEYTVIIDGTRFSDEKTIQEFEMTLSSISGIFYTKNNETNQYTLNMTETAYAELKELKSKDVTAKFTELINDSENYITDIKYDDDFRNVTVYADREKIPQISIESVDINIVTIAGITLLYQMYTVEGESLKITTVYSDTEEVVKVDSFPMVIQ